jgi:DNA polymerase III epsilon subunit-like protein
MPTIAAWCDRTPIWAGHNVQFDLDLLHLGCHVRRAPMVIVDSLLADCVLHPNPSLSRSLRELADRAEIADDEAHQAVGDGLVVGRYFERHWDKMPTYIQGLRTMMQLGAQIRTAQLHDRGKTDAHVEPPRLNDHQWSGQRTLSPASWRLDTQR